MFGGFPEFLVALFNLSSLTVGMIIEYILLLMFYIKKHSLTYRLKVNFVLFLFVVFISIVLSFFANINTINSYGKSIGSIFLLILMLYVAYLYGLVIIKSDFLQTIKSFRCALWLLFLIGIIGMIFGVYLQIYNKHSGPIPFLESSHYALYLGLFSMLNITLFQSLNYKFLVVLCTIMLAVLLPSLTLLIYALLMLAVIVKLNKSFFILVIVAGIMSSFSLTALIDMDYFLSRVDFLGDSNNNLSLLVYKQGLENAYYSLTETYFGIGFQNLSPKQVSESGEIIMQILNNDVGLNTVGGGFVAAKLVTELGWAGLLMIIFYLYLVVKSFFLLRKSSVENAHFQTIPNVIAASLIYASFVEFFVRGNGYFTPGIFIFLIGLSIYLYNYRSSSFPMRMPVVKAL